MDEQTDGQNNNSNYWLSLGLSEKRRKKTKLNINNKTYIALINEFRNFETKTEKEFYAKDQLSWVWKHEAESAKDNLEITLTKPPVKIEIHGT